MWKFFDPALNNRALEVLIVGCCIDLITIELWASNLKIVSRCGFGSQALVPLCFLQDAHILREAQLQLADAEKDEGFPYVVTRVPKTSAPKVGTCSTQGKGEKSPQP